MPLRADVERIAFDAAHEYLVKAKAKADAEVAPAKEKLHPKTGEAMDKNGYPVSVHYRKARPGSPFTCGTCSHFDVEAQQCKLYKAGATASMICDSFEPNVTPGGAGG